MPLGETKKNYVIQSKVIIEKKNKYIYYEEIVAKIDEKGGK